MEKEMVKIITLSSQDLLLEKAKANATVILSAQHTCNSKLINPFINCFHLSENIF